MIIEKEANKLKLSGALVADNLNSTLSTAKLLIAECDPQHKVAISLKGITENNGLFISFMLCCLRYGKQINRKVGFTDFSNELDNMIAVYNLTQCIKSDKSTKSRKPR
ncbi:MAG: hypothetical protein K0U41_00025 [Gammaproteobacteria bacterium]|nr:hypothetical protein [Gammaproteobacteria bacterium]